MCNKIQTSSHFQIWSILDDVKNTVSKPISQKKSKSLISQLEDIQKNCKDEEIKNQIICLYGKIMDAYNKHIEKEILSLTDAPDSLKMQKKISILKKSPGISLENLETLSKIDTFLLTKNLVLKEIVHEEIDDLFELAALVYYKEKEEKIQKALASLPSAAEKCLFKHLSSLRSPFLKERTNTLQALFAAAYELAGKSFNCYFTPKEIDLFFAERKKITEKDILNHPKTLPSLRLA